MVLRSLACAALLLSAACETAPTGPLTSIRFADAELPRGVPRSNRDLAEDFIDLTFALEGGDSVDRLLRYETPVRVYLASPELAPYRRDVEALLARLRTEAGIDIALTSDPAAQIQVEAVPAAQIARVFPTAACFIVPGETNWRDFRRRPNEERLRWADQDTLRGAAIFLPVDTAPQDVRDCLNEEITQALGPANDLYRLPDTVWNDDNFHGLATAFDMLILRTLYQPELRSGMSRAEAQRALPGVLGRVNPAGRGKPRQPRQPESRAWAGAIEAAMSQDLNSDERLGAARIATQIAVEMRPIDHRYGVSLLTLGRLNIRRDPVEAASNFSQAYEVFERLFGVDDIRTAQAGVHLAALALVTERNETAIALAETHVPTAQRAQNAILIAGFESIRAEALGELGRETESQQARLNSLRWARYGFGDDGALAREQARLAMLLGLEEG